MEQATAAALRRRRERPRLGGSLARGEPHGLPIYPDEIGYVQRIDMGRLQLLAERSKRHITVASLPGTFAAPDRPLAHISDLYDDGGDEVDTSDVKNACLIGQERDFSGRTVSARQSETVPPGLPDGRSLTVRSSAVDGLGTVGDCPSTLNGRTVSDRPK